MSSRAKFLFSFLVSRQMGIYAKTFNKIIIHDILKFGMILAIVLLAFAGSAYLALAASKAFSDDIRWVDYCTGETCSK